MAFRFFMVLMRKLIRGLVACALFAMFGAGAILMSPLMLILRRTDRCQRVVRAVWLPLVWLFVHLRLIRIERGNLPTCRGAILVANHPSLIDVVLLTVLIPRTLSVTKRAVGRNPIIGIMARTFAIPFDADQIGKLADYLSKGWNILIFPEGTRSPWTGTVPTGTAMGRFRRGAAQLALRAGAPIICIGISQSRRILAKHQPAWDMGTAPVVYRFRAAAPLIGSLNSAETPHVASVRLTNDLEAAIRQLLVDDGLQ